MEWKLCKDYPMPDHDRIVVMIGKNDLIIVRNVDDEWVDCGGSTWDFEDFIAWTTIPHPLPILPNDHVCQKGDITCKRIEDVYLWMKGKEQHYLNFCPLCGEDS